MKRSSRLNAPKRLHGLQGWLRERFIRHRGNADVAAAPLGRFRYHQRTAGRAERSNPNRLAGLGKERRRVRRVGAHKSDCSRRFAYVQSVFQLHEGKPTSECASAQRKGMLDTRRDMNVQQTTLTRRDRRAFHIRSGKKGLFGASIATPLRGTRFEFSALRQRQLTPCRKGNNYGYLRLWRNRTDFRRCVRRCRRSALVCLEPG